MDKTGKTLENIGENIGFFTAQSGLRLQQGVRSLRKGFQRGQNGKPTDAKGTEKKDQTAAKADHPTVNRAEAWVDRAGERCRQLTSFASLYVLRATARMREEVEDIWVEAQTVRGGQPVTRGEKVEQKTTPETGKKEEQKALEVSKPPEHREEQKAPEVSKPPEHREEKAREVSKPPEHKAEEQPEQNLKEQQEVKMDEEQQKKAGKSETPEEKKRSRKRSQESEG